MEGDIAAFRPEGCLTLHKAVAMVTDAIVFARDQGLRKLLVNTKGLTGFESPGLGERYFFVHEWARASAGAVRIAMVLRADMIDPHKFGITAAANAGLVADVFSFEDMALAWIRALE